MTNSTVSEGNCFSSPTAELDYRTFPNPHNPYYGALTRHPGDSWANGESWLVDSITGYPFCPIESGEPGPICRKDDEWLSPIIETGLTP